jgi:RNA polymerase sigma factor (sigma-70 family)
MDELVDRFEAQRPRPRGVAYRMLGSLSEADDAVQEAWLRLGRWDSDEIENLDGCLTTVVARVSLNMLRSRTARREVHVPEPIIDRADGVDPEHEALLADSVGLALLVVLDTLSPPERLAFVLHDIFAVPFDEIAPIVDRSPEAARQLASRARRRVRGEHTVPDADPETQREVIDAFVAAAREGDFDAARARQRRRRHGLAARRRAVLGRRPRGQEPQDRRDGHHRRPRAPQPARPVDTGVSAVP